MAARLAASSVPAHALGLAGQGLRDVTRITAGDPALWGQILAANAGPVAEVVAAVAEDLTAAARERGLAKSGKTGITGLLARGPAGVARLGQARRPAEELPSSRW